MPPISSGCPQWEALVFSLSLPRSIAQISFWQKRQSKKYISIIGTVLCLGALASLLWQTAISTSAQLWVLFIVTEDSFGIEVFYRMVTKRTIKISKEI
jgi:hypothetical protein